ncbi:MAG: FG-GAP-like repeat-containing protein, partial [Candidatus Cloacimonadaceae bacterium]|nr:FG-GAP-like repeat-containing protein [Candidatus Cloacimonadaceae bacterium]
MKLTHLSLVLWLLSIGFVGLNAQFTQFTQHIQGVYGAGMSWRDYDNDGDLDLLIIGSSTQYGTPSTRLYTNLNGNGFNLVTTNFQDVYRGSVSWGDYNNDGFLDFALCGMNSLNIPVTVIYRGNGTSSFTAIDAGIIGLDYSCLEWGDYNNDGLLDLVICGISGGINYTRIYRNDGNDTFTNIHADIVQVSYSVVSWGDYDNDGDLDLLIAGNGKSKVYRNDGNDVFVDIEAEIEPIWYNGSCWIDYDGDGFLDILIEGQTGNTQQTLLYRNTGNRTFENTPIRLEGLHSGSVKPGDFNADGKSDICLTGRWDQNRRTTIYRNESWGIFTDIHAGLPGLSSSYSSWGDFNNDGRLDLVIAGYTGYDYHAAVYRNDFPYVNTPPSPPIVSFDYENMTFVFSGAMDDSTPLNALTYNIKIGTSPGAIDVLSPMASDQGYRRVVGRGRKAYKFNPQPDIVYYVSAQSIDSGFMASGFGPEIEVCLPASAIIAYEGANPFDFGSVHLTHSSQAQTLTIRNTGLGNLTLDSIDLLGLDSAFSLVHVHTPVTIAPNAIHSIELLFSPLSNGIISDSLVVMSNAVNSPRFTIGLVGRGVSSPPAAVQNLQMTVLGNDVHLSWDAVTTTTTGEPIEVNRYLVLMNMLPDEDHFWYLANTTETSYIHLGSHQFSPNMFYRIIALVLYDRDD